MSGYQVIKCVDGNKETFYVIKKGTDYFYCFTSEYDNRIIKGWTSLLSGAQRYICEEEAINAVKQFINAENKDKIEILEIVYNS